jgi:DNA-binding response OmpR family regulator
VLLDIMMPRLDGYAVCAELRRLANPVPVLMLTAKGQIDDRVGDWTPARTIIWSNRSAPTNCWRGCGRCLRRARKRGRCWITLRLGDAQIDFARQQAWRKKTPLHLTAKEFAMLRLMMETPGEPVSRERFLDVVWGYTAFPTTRTVDTHIASLRAALEPNPESPRWIKTVHGIGYRLDPPAQ